MSPDLRWITPLYRFSSDQDHVGVPEAGRNLLTEMSGELIAGDGLVAIYIPEGAEDIYEAGGMRGRVAGVVRLLKMPRGKRMEDYYFEDWDGSRRWPIGWPCQVVYAPDESNCPFLREYVENLFGEGSFGGYVKRFQLGPFELEPSMRDLLNRDFAQFAHLA